MRIRIATRGIDGSKDAMTADAARYGIKIPWVELDSLRTCDVVDAKIETNNQGPTHVTLTFLAAAEMVLVDGKGEEL